MKDSRCARCAEPATIAGRHGYCLDCTTLLKLPTFEQERIARLEAALIEERAKVLARDADAMSMWVTDEEWDARARQDLIADGLLAVPAALPVGGEGRG